MTTVTLMVATSAGFFVGAGLFVTDKGGYVAVVTCPSPWTEEDIRLVMMSVLAMGRRVHIGHIMTIGMTGWCMSVSMAMTMSSMVLASIVGGMVSTMIVVVATVAAAAVIVLSVHGWFTVSTTAVHTIPVHGFRGQVGCHLPLGGRGIMSTVP